MKKFFVKTSLIVTALFAITAMNVSAYADEFVPSVEKEQVFTSKVEDQTATVALIESRTWYRMLTKVKIANSGNVIINRKRLS